MPRYATLDDVLASYPSRFRPDRAEGVDATVHMQLTGDGGRDATIHVHDGTLDVAEGVPESPTLQLTATAEDWLAVENGEMNPMMAMMQGKLKLKGSIPFATKFMGMFGYGG